MESKKNKNIIEDIYRYSEEDISTDLRNVVGTYSDILEFWRDYWYHLIRLYAIKEANEERIKIAKSPENLSENIGNLLKKKIMSEETVSNAKERVFAILYILSRMDKEKAKIFTNNLLGLNSVEPLLREG